MAILAIRGHETRGKEVIEILEMLGGENEYELRGTNEECVYFEKNGVIYNTSPFSVDFNNIKLFTLEEFLEKFPYKVGDKILVDNQSSKILKMRWNSQNNKVYYTIENYKGIYTAEYLQPYKEEIMESKMINQMSLVNCDLDEVEIVLGDKFELVNREGKYYAVKKKDQYPKTFEECCDVLRIFYTESTDVGYEFKLLRNLRRLLICRDAYWKIAGKQMGLNDLWKPDWKDNYQKKWTINFYQDEINLTKGPNVHFALAFPTQEMRDVFYENFKDLIEKCKELL